MSSSSKRLVISDFDRTLFDTGAFVLDLIEAIHTTYGFDPQAFRDEIAERSRGEFYDLFAHLSERGIAQAEAEPALHALLKRRSYVFSDVTHFIKSVQHRPATDFAIVTVGADSYQQFKFKLAPELHGLPFHIVPYNKGRWLDEQWGDSLTFEGATYDEVFVIDDKPETFEPFHTGRAGLHLVQIVRPGAQYRPRLNVVTDLGQITI